MEVTIKTKIKELLNHGLVYGLTSSLQSILGFVLLPILTVYYTPEEFGIYSIILLVSALASALFYFGASSALARFYFEENSDLYRKKITSAALFITLIGAILLISGSVIFGSYLSVLIFDSSSYYLHFVLACCGAAFTFLLNLMTLLLRYEKRSGLFMKVTLLGVFINFGITYVLLSTLSSGILAPLCGTLVSSILCFFLILVNNISGLTTNLQSSHLRKILSFGLQASVSGFLFYLLSYIDRLILKELVPMSYVGIYSLGSKIAAVINVMLIVPFSLIWAPMRMEYVSNNNNQEFTEKIFSYLSIVGLILILISVLFAQDLMSFVFVNKEFSDASKVFPIIMLALLFLGFQNIVDLGIHLTNKIFFFSVVALIAIVFNVIMNYWLIPHFGYMASAYVMCFTYFISTSLIYLISSHYYKIKLEWSRIGWPFVVLIIMYYFVNFSDFFESYGLLKKLFSMFFLCLAFRFFWLTKKEQKVIGQYLTSKN